ncbi:MAG: hypothetical protein C7B45_08450 [Sulfobacillus acidophilus]|uniref:DUF58 domain-containing protein n=1 Tax=Sulfobacillus acidophilus TaxID=53633 RepID=A0A2T2WIF7_9FIRM|nr:MAG: hypothetical protein C7B45_08450 [Sulfobacillus acidophilus]
MNPRTVWVLVISTFLVVILYAISQGGLLAWHLFGFLAVVIGLGLLMQLSPMHRIRVTRTVTPGPYYAGQSLIMTLNVSCSTRWLWPYVMIQDELPEELGLMDPTFIVHRLPPRGTSLSYQIPDLKRGVWDLKQVRLSTGDPFGLFRHSLTVDIPQKLVVWPKIVSLSASQLSALFWQGTNPARHLTRQHATYLRGVRDYVAGDRLSHVHWKTSARTGVFKVKQFEPQTLPQCTIVLDRACQFSPQEWEIALSVAASFVSQALQSKDAIGLMALDVPRAKVGPATGPSPFAAMMNFLSTLPYTTTTNATVEAGVKDMARRVIITTAERVQVWQNLRDGLVVIGPGALQDLDDLPHYLNGAPSMHRGPS